MPLNLRFCIFPFNLNVARSVLRVFEFLFKKVLDRVEFLPVPDLVLKGFLRLLKFGTLLLK